MENHFEHEHMDKHLDESVSNIGGHVGHGGGGRPMGGHFVGGRPMRTPMQRHMGMVRRFYNRPVIYNGGFNRRIGIAPNGLRYFRGGGGLLLGYGYDFWQPFFYAIVNGNIFEEAALREKYNLSDYEWNRLIKELYQRGFIVIN
jgi:hypothetical protein